MIDIHSHILPEIDDGSKNLKESLEMAKIAIKDGIHTIIATPHITSESSCFIQAKVLQLNEALKKAQLPLTIRAGGEIPLQINTENLEDYTLSKSSYLLVELPHEFVPSSTTHDISNLQALGYRIIIAHPERNREIIKRPELLQELLDYGVLTQITSGSITGDFGPQVQYCAHHLLRQQMVHCIASDSHNAHYRKPVLKKSVIIAGKIIGKKNASRLVHDNPQKILDNSPSITIAS